MIAQRDVQQVFGQTQVMVTAWPVGMPAPPTGTPQPGMSAPTIPDLSKAQKPETACKD